MSIKFSKFTNVIKNKKFTFIEIIIVVVTVGIVSGIAIPKFIGVHDSAKLYAMNIDLEMVENAVEEYISVTNGKEFPFVDISKDGKIDENDIVYKVDEIPESIKYDLSTTSGDDGSEIYKLDMDKLDPYINGLKHNEEEFLYSTISRTAIHKTGFSNNTEIVRHTIGHGIKKDIVKDTVTTKNESIYSVKNGFFYISKETNELIAYQNGVKYEFGVIKDTDALIGNHFLYKFTEEGKLYCIYDNGYAQEVDLSIFERNNDRLNIEKDTIKPFINGLIILTKKGNVYNIYGSSISYNDKYNKELNPNNTEVNALFYTYFTLHTDKAFYLFSSDWNIGNSYKVEIQGGINKNDIVFSGGLYTFIVKEDGTIYFLSYQKGNSLKKINTKNITNGINLDEDIVFTSGALLYVLKGDGELYYIDGDSDFAYRAYTNIFNNVNVKDLQVFNSNNVYYTSPMLIDEENGKIYTVNYSQAREFSMKYNSDKDIIKAGGQNGLYLVQDDGKIYKQNNGEIKLLSNLSKYNLNFNTKKDNIQFNDNDICTIVKENGSIYYINLNNNWENAIKIK